VAIDIIRSIYDNTYTTTAGMSYIYDRIATIARSYQPAIASLTTVYDILRIQLHGRGQVLESTKSGTVLGAMWLDSNTYNFDQYKANHDDIVTLQGIATMKGRSWVVPRLPPTNPRWRAAATVNFLKANAV